jgi:Lysyl oxidase
MTLHTQTRRFSRRALAAFVSLLVLAGLLAATVVPATGAEGDELLPDLVAEPVGQADTTATTDTVNGQTRLLLRFTSYVRNIGAGPLEVTGVNPVNGKISGVGLKQVLTHNHDTDGVVGLDKSEVDLPGAELKYEQTDLHNHWHFQRAARYSLWNDGQTTEIDASSKVGFCFLDIGHGDPTYDPKVDDPIHFLYTGTVAPKTFGSSTNNCLAHLPSFPDPTDDVVPQRTKVDMGISTGWRDVYERTLPFQYIDVSNLQPGHYWLRSQVDPDGLIRESNDTNAAVFASARSTVPGYIAKPIGQVNPFQVSGVKDSTSTITLSQDSFRNTAAGTPALGLPQYKITEQPEHGTLVTGTQDAGGWFSGAQIVYKKDGSYNGPDDFKYTVRQGTSQFPLNPASAAVMLQVGSGDGDTAVGISGNPAWLYTSQGAQLSVAITPADGSTAVWAVDGEAGGNATVGTIDTNGYYKAPAKVPADGKVRITATAPDGAFDAVEVPIKARPAPPATPDLPDPPLPPSDPAPPSNPTKPTIKPLSKPIIARNGRRLVVKYMPGKTGKLSVTVSRKGKRLATCKVGVVRARGATCRFTIKKSKLKKLTGSLTVSAKLTVKGKTVATRRTTVSLKVKSSSSRVGPLCILVPIKH